MIDYNYVRRTVETHLSNNFTTVPVVLENTSLKSQDQEYIAVFEGAVKANSMGMGEDSLVVYSDLVIEIFTQEGSGTKKAREIADELVEIVQTLDDVIVFGEPIFDSQGAVDGAKLYKHTLTYSYVYIYGQTE